jgi:nitroreductase
VTCSGIGIIWSRRCEVEVFDAVRTVLAVRSYLSKPIPPELTRRIVDAARLTASSMNRQPWHFIVVDNPKVVAQLGGLARTGPYIAEAPLAVVVVIEKSDFAVSDASRAIQSMILTAWSEGVGSNWVGFFGLDGVRPVLGIPGNLDVLAIIPFGYPSAAKSGEKKKRKPIQEVIHRERFDTPFE